ncbi:tetratricopeptide repeat protein [Pseudoalteromonas sp. YIC-656]|uniref:tetratricopeptide repeat protein n=1 Tax=Pseudoalteromonas pernae TaxID=3118054 RepID=UPI003242C4ED
MKTLKLALALYSATYFTSSFAGDYKLAVINDELTSDAVVSGQYAQALQLGQNASQNVASAFETSVNQCAANIQLGKADEAISLCNTALQLIKEVRVDSTKRREMTAYAYSNRGIAYSLKNEFDAALSDFSTAYGTNKNTITRANYKLAKTSAK